MNYDEIIKELIMSNARRSPFDDATVFKIIFRKKNVIAAIPSDDFKNNDECLQLATEILFAKIYPEYSNISQQEAAISNDDDEEEPLKDTELYETFKEKQNAKREKLLNFPLCDVKEFTTRLHTYLWKNEIFYVRDLIERSEEDFIAIKGVGKGMIKQIKSFVTKNGLRLKK